MDGPDFAECPACRSKTWEDLAALGDPKDPFRFRCARCGHIIRLAGCTKCNGTRWDRLKDVFGKDSKKPVVRYRCSRCGRIIGIILDQEKRSRPRD
jgi:DNA-directed RNA polymerase subunit RPC12/RpoP